MPAPRVFVSHSHQDDAFTVRLVADLRAAGADVWVDMANIDHGDFMQRIDEALARCDWVVLVLTPHAIASQYVRMEVNAALHRVHQGLMRDVIPIVAAPCPHGSIPPLWDVLHRYNAVENYTGALAGITRALHLRVNSQAEHSPQVVSETVFVAKDPQSEPASVDQSSLAVQKPASAPAAVAARLGESSIYARLADHLAATPPQQANVRLTFVEIERILDRSLPPSAWDRHFWANNTRGHRQSELWLAAGWEVTSINLPEETITFSRLQHGSKDK